MKIFALTLFSLILTLKSEETQKEEKLKDANSLYLNDSLIVLNNTNYNNILNTYNKLVILFLSTKCDLSKAVYPSFEAANRLLIKRSINVSMARVDVSVHSRIATRFTIEGTPRVFFFSKERSPIEFRGKSDQHSIVEWITDILEPIKEYNNITHYEIIKNSKNLIVTFFGNKNSTAYSTFENIKNEFSDENFAVCSGEEFLSKYNAKKDSVVIFKKFDELRGDISNFDSQKLLEFINFHIYPSVMTFNLRSINLLGNQQPIIVLYRDPKDAFTSVYEELFTKVAQEMKGKTKLKFIISSIRDGTESKIAKMVDVVASDLPLVMIIKANSVNDIYKYRLKNSINEKNLMEFINEYEKGTLKRTVKSQEVPTTQKLPVYLVVGNTFEDIVKDPSKDVIIAFMKPFEDCNECKIFYEKTFEAAAKALEHNTELIFTSFNIQDNEAIGINGNREVPFVKFFPMENKENPLEYKGVMKDYALIEWLMEHTTNPISRYPKYDL